MAATHLNGVGNPLEAQATTLASFEPIMASPPSKRVPALRPMAKSLDSAKLHHRHIAGLHDLFGSAVAHSTDGLPARRRGTLPTSAIVQPSTAAPTTADPAAPALTGFSSSDDDEGDNNDDATTNAGPMFVHVASADLQSPAHIVATARNADALLRVHRVDPKSDAVKDCHTATHKQRASPTSHSPPADFSVGSELGKVPSSVPEPSSATHDANRAVLPPPDEPDDHLILYNPALDEFSYFKACCGVAALRLAARLQYLVELAARFILEGHDTRTSEAAHDIRVMVGDDPATWPSSMATVERIAPRVLAMRDAALDICRFGVLGVQSGAVWNRAVDALRRHCAALPICASGDVKPGSIHHPPLTCVTFHWERIHPSTPKRQPGSGSAPPPPVDDHNENDDDDEEDDEDSWSTDEESSIPRSAVLPPIAIQTAQLDNGDNGDGWSDGGEDLQGCKTVTHSSSQANIVSIQATPTAATPGRKWSGNAGEYIEAEIRRFSARRESRLRCAPLPRLHLSLFPDTHETTRSLSRSWAQESTSSFATCGHVGMDEVLPGMFCGSREPSEDLMHLELNGITHVVSCINTQPFAESSTLSYTVLDMLDNEEQPLIAPAQLATAAIERRWLHGGENVLIHCGSGVSRAPAVTIYALCALFPELTSSTVGSILRHGRPYTLMNGGFKRQLSEAYPDHSGSHLGGTRTSSPRSSAPLRSGSVPPLNNNNNACD